MKPRSSQVLAYYYGFPFRAIYGNAFVAKRSYVYPRHVVESANAITGVL